MNSYDKVTNAIVDYMEQGINPWNKRYRHNVAINYDSRKPYRGVNRILLPFGGEYITWNSIQKHKGHVKKGSKANLVVFYTPIEYQKVDEDTGEVENKKSAILRNYTVFPLSCVDGIETKISKEDLAKENEILLKPNEIVESYINRSGVRLDTVENCNKACYIPSEDRIVVPVLNDFFESESYYSTLFHEMAHSTGHADRLNRTFGKRFGDEKYSKEELVAEITSSFLCHESDIDTDLVFKNSVAYLQSWIKALKNDNKLIISASSQAEKCTDFILNGSVEWCLLIIVEKVGGK